MPSQDPKIRAKNFTEVALGYSLRGQGKRPAGASSVPNAPAPWLSCRNSNSRFYQGLREDNLTKAARHPEV